MQPGLITEIILPLSLAIIMLGMGLSLVIDDFKRVFIFPKAVLIGTTCQLLALPLIGFLLASIFPISPEIAVGTMILVACAGGATSNMIVYLAKGDIALSVTLTAISSAFTVITIPFIVNFALEYFMHIKSEQALPIFNTNMRLFTLTLLPVLIGMFVRANAVNFARKMETILNRFASLFFIVLLIAITYKEKATLANAISQVGTLAFVLNTSTMILGFSLARFFKLNKEQSTSISIEVGVQNSATAIFIAVVLLDNSKLAVMPALYSLIMYINAILLIFLLNNHRLKTVG